MTVGQVLRKFRMRARLDLHAFSVRAGTTVAVITKFETNQIRPDKEQLKQLAQGLEIVVGSPAWEEFLLAVHSAHSPKEALTISSR